jgi:hypothetical protein
MSDYVVFLNWTEREQRWYGDPMFMLVHVYHDEVRFDLDEKYSYHEFPSPLRLLTWYAPGKNFACIVWRRP